MEYNAFITYSHADCGNIAPSIQKALENIGKPWYKIKRNLTIFRDETNLAASPTLWHTIEDALSNSSNLILLASPQASESYWVKKELENWLQNHYSSGNGLTNFYIVKTAGHLVWDIDNADWDWEKTNCLPTILKGKFSEVPRWIDLSEFVNQNNLPINYKSPSFTSNLVKIVAGIVNKFPREIESDELSRRRNTTLALVVSSFVFISLLLFGYLLNTENKINERNSIANNLIAEGNRFRQNDINEALLRYTYAYKINPTAEIFTIISDFYKQVIIDTIKIDTVKKNYTLNKFYSNTYINYYKKEDRAIVFSMFFPSLDLYCVTKGKSIVFHDLHSKKKLFSFDLKNCRNVSGDGTSILFETENNDLFVYHVNTRSLDTIAKSGKLKSNGHDVISEYQGSKFIQAYIKNSNIVIFQQASSDSIKINVGDVSGKEWKEYSVYNNSTGTQIGMMFNLINCKFDSVNRLLHYSSSIGYGNQYYYEEIRNLNYKDSILYTAGKTFRDSYTYSITSLFIKDYFIIGFYNGQIEVHKEFDWDGSRGETLRNSPKAIDIGKGLADFILYKDYLIAGYDNGKLNFYLVYGNEDMMNNDRLQFEQMPLLKSASISSVKEIVKLNIYNDILFITTSSGSLFEIHLTLVVNLDTEPDKLLKQVKKIIGDTDLSINEKKRLKIIK